MIMIKPKPKDASSPKINLNGIIYDYFCGCGYHNFQDFPEIRQAAVDCLDEFPIKSGPAHYGYGTNPVQEKFVQTAKKYFQTESILTYPSGYMGNIILFRALEDKYDKIFVDKESHYSMKDAVDLSGKPSITFLHLDSKDLERKIKDHLKPHERPLIASDGVFPVSGAIAPIPEYLKVIENINDAIIVIDDCHGTGVIGQFGRGTYEYFGLNRPNLYFCGTMSKAFGSHGGIIPCSQNLFDSIFNYSIILKGSTEIPNPTLAASRKAMEILMEHPILLRNLQNNALYLKKGLVKLGFEMEISPSGIVCISPLDSIKLEDLYQFYKDNLILPNYIDEGKYTSVPKGGGIKFTIFSNHGKPQLDHVLNVTKEFLRKHTRDTDHG